MKRILSFLLALLFAGTAHAQANAPETMSKLPPSVTIPAPPTAALEKVPTSRGEMSLSFAPIVRKVAPAVVNIYTQRTVKQQRNPFMDDPFLRQFFGGNMPQGMSRDRVERSLGSGVIVKAEGMVVTNNHVIDGADQITVALSDRREFEADVVAKDARLDLAVLRLKSKGETFPTVPLMDSDDAQVGDLVLAVGNPFGVGQTVTMGIVSATARANELGASNVNYFIQTDSAINPGNSGGALVSSDGRLMGIPSSIYSRDGGSLGIGFAIPANLVNTMLTGAKSGKIVFGWAGFDAQTVTPELAATLGQARPSGTIVSKMHPLSPAAAAGLKVGDVIIAANGHAVDDNDALRFRLVTAAPGSQVTLKIKRKDKEETISYTAITPPETPRDESVLAGRQPLAGAKVVNLSPAIQQELELQDDEGVIAIAIQPGSAADVLGLEPGDGIATINNVPVKNVAQLKKLVADARAPMQIGVKRGGRILNVIVR